MKLRAAHRRTFAWRSVRRHARARRAANRVGVEPSCHRDAELFRRGAGAVRLGGEGRRHAARRTNYDLVVTVAGPRVDMVTRRKERWFGIWINTDSRQFLQVPTYLALFSNRPFDAIASPEVQRRQQLGLNNVLLTQRVGPDYADVVPSDPFRSAFVRLRKQHGLYREETSAVTFLTPTLFRTGIPLPAEVPIGTYNVEIKLFADGALVTQDRDRVRNRQGRLRTVRRQHREATRPGLRLATAIMALMTGWMASIVFRKD